MSTTVRPNPKVQALRAVQDALRRLREARDEIEQIESDVYQSAVAFYAAGGTADEITEATE